MATSVQEEEGHINGGLLPPLKELFLEIQVYKLIQEYLFSSNAEEMCTSLYGEAPKHNQEKASDQLYAAGVVLVQTACNAPCVKSSTDKQSPHDPHRKPKSQASSALHSITCTIDDGMHKNTDQTATTSFLQTENSTHEASLATILVENGGEVMLKTAHLNRAGTFTCTDNVQLQAGMPMIKAKMLKASCKKPPRPPKVPKSELSFGCCSDDVAYRQSTRRERRRKATRTATSNPYTSILALLFTSCFVIIMVVQGFRSLDSQNFSAFSSVAFSSTQTIMRASFKQSPEEASLAGRAERQASMEGVLAEDVSAQVYVTRKAQLQPLSDTKSLELDIF